MVPGDLGSQDSTQDIGTQEIGTHDFAVPDIAALAVEVDEASAAFLLAVGRSAEDLHPRVSPPQLRALLVLERDQPVKLGQLAAELGTIPSSASRLCDRLQAAGLIERRIGDTDRRAIRLELTQEAVRLLERLRTRRRAHLDAVLRSMSAAGRAALLTGLRQFSEAATLTLAAEAAPVPTPQPAEPRQRVC